MARIVILGAGLTGLSAAYHLEQSGNNDYVIFEKEERPGGLLRSFQQDGFTFDYTGHLLHINNDYFKQFLMSILDFNLLKNIQRKSAIYTHERFINYPFQMNLNGLPTDVIYQCIDGFIKRTTSRSKPTTFYDWVLKHFGSGIGKHFFFPYNSKILSYDVKKIHPSWTGRFVPQTSLEALLKGALEKKESDNVGYNSSFYYPEHGGIEFLIKHLIKQIKQPIATGYIAQTIDLVNKQIIFENGHIEPFEELISTIPLNVLLKNSLEPSRSTLKKASNKLLCTSVLNFNLGFNQEKINNHHWLYFPEKNYPFYRLGFWDNINKASVKPGHSALYGECSFLQHTKTETQQKKLIKKSIKQTLSLLNLSSSNIVIEKTLTLNHAYVIYDTWREKNLHKLLKTLSKNFSIHSVGRFGQWKYSSMQEAVLDGKEIAQKIIQEKISAEEKVIIPGLKFIEKTNSRDTITTGLRTKD